MNKMQEILKTDVINNKDMCVGNQTPLSSDNISILDIEKHVEGSKLSLFYVTNCIIGYKTC